MLLNHHALKAVAEAANVRPSELKRNFAIIEKSNGIPVLETVGPLRLAAAGRMFLQQVRPVLRRYSFAQPILGYHIGCISIQQRSSNGWPALQDLRISCSIS
ncbi:hypothetical protein [Streptomyces sp. NPDC008137]|uniref:hypothetical protein n=1 Tax=Streptomyces sp. NPDC008137 TaxID=3364813 RepID=UPI0036E6FAD9